MSKTDEIKNALSSYFRVRSQLGLGRGIADFAPLEGGRQHEMYSFVLTGGTGAEARPRPAVLRLYDGAKAAVNAKFEYTVMKEVTSAYIPVPEMFCLEPDPGFLGRPFIVMEKVEGATLGSIIKERLQLETSWIASGGAVRLIDRFAGLLSRFHDLDPGAFESGYFRKNPWLPNTHEDFFRKLGGVSASSPYEFFKHMEDWLRKAGQDAANSEVVMLHYDFHPDNVLIHEGEVSALLDLCEVCTGDAAFDVAWAVLRFSFDDLEDLTPLFIESYKRQSGRTLENLVIYEVMAGIRQFCDLLRLRDSGAGALDKRPDANELYKIEEELEKTGSFITDRTGVELGRFYRRK